MEDAYGCSADFLLAQWRAGRSTSAETWAALQALGARSPQERLLRRWQRVMADAVTRALYWLLRAAQQLGRWRPAATEALTAEARETVLARVSAYLTNTWYALKNIRCGILPQDLQLAEQRARASLAGCWALRTFPVARLPQATLVLNEP